MDASEFERDLHAWIDGELPEARAAQMKEASDASPELAERATLARAFDERVRRSLRADPHDAESVRRMIAAARSSSRPAGRVLRLPRGVSKIAAGLVLAVTVGMWWMCIPPFECSYMQALEVAAQDPTAVPGEPAEACARRCGLPSEVDGAVAAVPPALANLDFWFWHLKGLRLDYVRPDGSAFHTVLCEESSVQPSARRRVVRDGAEWWMADISGSRVVAFPVKAGAGVCAVTGPAGDETVYAAAKALRASLR